MSTTNETLSGESRTIGRQEWVKRSSLRGAKKLKIFGGTKGSVLSDEGEGLASGRASIVHHRYEWMWHIRTCDTQTQRPSKISREDNGVCVSGKGRREKGEGGRKF